MKIAKVVKVPVAKPRNAATEEIQQRIWLKELASDPRIGELKEASKLLRFHLEHLDEGRWTQVQVAQALNVSTRTVYNHRQKIIRFGPCLSSGGKVQRGIIG